MPLALLRRQNPLRYTDCFPRKRMMGQSKALLPKPRDSGIAFWDRLLRNRDVLTNGCGMERCGQKCIA